jgi:hypothetical protein
MDDGEDDEDNGVVRPPCRSRAERDKRALGCIVLPTKRWVVRTLLSLGQSHSQALILRLKPLPFRSECPRGWATEGWLLVLEWCRWR